MSSCDLPRLPDYCLTYDYEDAGAHKELVASCPKCLQRQRTGLRLGDPVPEAVVARIKDRLVRYHNCPASALRDLADRDLDSVLDAFGFPDWLRIEGRRPDPSLRKWGAA